MDLLGANDWHRATYLPGSRPWIDCRSRWCPLSGPVSHPNWADSSHARMPYNPCYRHEMAKTVAPMGYNRSVPVPLHPPAPNVSRNWHLGSPIGAGGGRRTRSGPSISSTRRPGSGGWRRCGTGSPFALGLPLSEAEGIQMGFVDGRVNPNRTMICVNEPLDGDPEWIASSEDVVTLAMQCATHWDGLAHVSYGAGPDGAVLYNGYPASTVTEEGASKLGIHLVGVAGVPGGAARRSPGQGRGDSRARLPDRSGRSGRRLRARWVDIEAGDVCPGPDRSGRPPRPPRPTGSRRWPNRRGTWWPTPGRRPV